MGRAIKDWNPTSVCATPVAPHRYTWDRDTGHEWMMDRSACRKAAPYAAGDVIWVDVGGKAMRALILAVMVERDHHGFYRELYRVARETGKGFWAKQWTQAWPGQVQRGYAIAGVAKDIPLEEWK